MERRAWTPDEVDLLKRRSASSALKDLAAELDRPVKMVRWKVKQLGLPVFDARTLNPGRAAEVWTDERLGYLREHSQTTPVRDLARHLGVSERAVRGALYDYKIPGRGRGAAKTDEGLESIREKARQRREDKYPPAGPWECVRCKESKSLSDFTGHVGRANHLCRVCQRTYWLQHAYGISAAQYTEMLEEQGGVCAICSLPETRKKEDGETFALAVDHDHSCCPGKKTCGKCLRGLLCWECNNILGKVEAKEGMLDGLRLYLDAHVAGR